MQIVLEELQTTKQEKEQLLDKLNETLGELENSKGLIEIHQAQHQSVSFCNNSNYETKKRVKWLYGQECSQVPGLIGQQTEISVEYLRKMLLPARAMFF